MKKSMVLTGALAALALGVLAPTAASAAPVSMDGGWTFSGETYNDDIWGSAKCNALAVAREKIYFGRDYDCHWAVPLKIGAIGLWYR